MVESTPEATGEIETITDAKVVKNGDTPADKFKRYMLDRAAIEGESMAYDVAANQVSAIMEAAASGDIQAIWDADTLGMTNAQSLEDVEQIIKSYTVHKSTDDAIETPWGIFVIVHAARMDKPDEEIIWNTGAPLIISKLRAFEAVGAFPLEAVIRGTKASKGRVLKLAPVPVRVVRN